MKTIRILAFITLCTAVLNSSCTSDDTPDFPQKPELANQLQLEPQSPILGLYAYPQAGFSVGYEFQEKAIVNKTLKGQGSNAVGKIAKVYQHPTDGVYKLILQYEGETGYDNLYIRNIAEETVEIHTDQHWDTESEAIAAVYPDPKAGFVEPEHLGWLCLIKQSTSPLVPLDVLIGTYSTDFDTQGLVKYKFQLGDLAERFMFFAQYNAEFKQEGYLALKRVFSNAITGQMVFEISEAAGYYKTRGGQFLTLYARDVAADGSTARIAIATTTGTQSIADSKGDVIGKTLDEAKAIRPPDKDAVWQFSMMNYAQLWLPTVRE